MDEDQPVSRMTIPEPRMVTRTDVPDSGQVYIGRELGGKRVEITVQVIEDPTDTEE
ncbi:hypothetical protein [Halobaculum sp. MBLA0143]|uniref:hypothetical protein n=1 Tax=Halobaculum sp. MBLA0143 TaxID=3079933 RepID=UPI003525C06C